MAAPALHSTFSFTRWHRKLHRQRGSIGPVAGKNRVTRASKLSPRRMDSKCGGFLVLRTNMRVGLLTQHASRQSNCCPMLVTRASCPRWRSRATSWLLSSRTGLHTVSTGSRQQRQRWAGTWTFAFIAVHYCCPLTLTTDLAAVVQGSSAGFFVAQDKISTVDGEEALHAASMTGRSSSGLLMESWTEYGKSWASGCAVEAYCHPCDRPLTTG